MGMGVDGAIARWIQGRYPCRTVAWFVLKISGPSIIPVAVAPVLGHAFSPGYGFGVARLWQSRLAFGRV